MIKIHKLLYFINIEFMILSDGSSYAKVILYGFYIMRRRRYDIIIFFNFSKLYNIICFLFYYYCHDL